MAEAPDFTSECDSRFSWKARHRTSPGDAEAKVQEQEEQMEKLAHEHDDLVVGVPMGEVHDGVLGEHRTRGDARVMGERADEGL